MRSASNMKLFQENSLYDKFLCFASDHCIYLSVPIFFFSSENGISSHLLMGTMCLHLVISIGKEMVIYAAALQVMSCPWLGSAASSRDAPSSISYILCLLRIASGGWSKQGDRRRSCPPSCVTKGC